MALLAAYHADEASGPVVDATGNGHNISLGSNLTRVTGHTSTGMAKNNVGMPVVATPALAEGSARTFMFWLQGAGNGVWVFRNYIIAADTGSWGFYILSGNATLRLRKGGSNTNITTSFPVDGAWHHWAGTYDGTNSRLYLDGVLVATSGTVSAPLDAADRTEILEGSVTSQVMDDLRIYNEALTQSQISTLMGQPVTNAGVGTAELAGTLPKATLAADATATAVAELAGTLRKATLAGTASVSTAAALTGSLARATLAADATVLATAELAANLPRATASLTVTEQTAVTATLSAILPKPVGGTGITASMETRMQRRNTLAFIEASPVDIALTPQTEQRTPSGAVTFVDGSLRPVQRFRLIPMSHTERPVTSTSGAGIGSGGVQRKYDMTLLGTWDSTIQENDYWYDGDQKYVVEAVIPYNGYERKGLVMSYGRRGSIVA